MKVKKEEVTLIKSQRASTEYNTLPTKVTRKEFNQFIKPHLSMSKTQKPNLSYFKIFNYILYVLHTGIQWENLPVRGCHFTNIYRHHNRWSKDGSFKKVKMAVGIHSGQKHKRKVKMVLAMLRKKS